ncbi:MAG: SAM-dependent methyltransferase [Porticoccus sp.]|nr:SAM-dependent methyltransferase [Porticoccus sp.]
MITKSLLGKIIKVGNLTWISPNGELNTYGDGSGEPIRIRTTNSFSELKLLIDPSVHFGESYMNGSLIVEEGLIHDFLKLIFLNTSSEIDHWVMKLSKILRIIQNKIRTNNYISKSKYNVAHHYDLSDKLYKLFLDPDRQYSCAYFNSPNDTLEQAQINKKELISKKLILEEDQSVLDIGCGWGGMAAHIYKKSNASVVGVTLSEEQYAYANQRKINEKLDKVEYRLQDYRNVNESYDRIVSVGMFEHVGTSHYQEFFNKVHDLLNDTGVALIHTIGRLTEPTNNDPWIEKYIFPGGYIPALSETMLRVEKSGLTLADVQVLKFHYAETLKRWRYNFYDNIDKVKELYDEKFCRMWDFYLSSSQASFEEAGLVVFQLQLSKNKKTVPDKRDYLLA